MRLIRKMLRYDWAAYWAPLAGNDDFGQPRVANPVDIRCRWEQGGEQQVTLEAELRFAKDVVYVEVDVIPGGYLYHGSRDDLPNTKVPDTAVRIVEFKKFPTMKNDQYLRMALT